MNRVLICIKNALIFTLKLLPILIPILKVTIDGITALCKKGGD